MTESMLMSYQKAIRLHQQARAIYAQSYGPDDYRVGITEANIGTAYFRSKQYLPAEKAFRAALAIQIKARGEDSIDTAVARIKLGRTLLYQERYREAAEQSGKGFNTLKRQSTASTSFLSAARQDLIVDYEALNEHEKANSFR